MLSKAFEYIEKDTLVYTISIILVHEFPCFMTFIYKC